jgi:tetratricopeptide (TPR) repeat protein
MTSHGTQRKVLDQSLQAAREAFARGHNDAALETCRQLLKRDKKNVDALELMGRCYTRGGRFDEAESCFRRCVKSEPKNARVQLSIARMELARNDARAALMALNKAIKLDPSFNEAIAEKAAILERMGRYDEAKRTLAKLDGVDERNRPDVARIECTVALHEGEYNAAIEIADRFIDDPKVSAVVRCDLAFRRGLAYEKLGDADEAMASWRIGNQLMKAPFDPESYVREIDREIAFFTPETLDELPHATNDTELPVFIAGMPRSGTTLIEQIIDAHPQCRGAGELRDVDYVIRDLNQAGGPDKRYPECLRDLDANRMDELARSYLATLRSIGGDVARVVNKSLRNYRQLGLISLLWPKARVILCRRDPIDTCLSIYMNQFRPEHHPFATNLAHIGVAYRQAERLLEHWKQVLALPILEVQYEDLIGDQESQTRRMIEFCGLEWDDQCLQFHDSGRTVMTLSYHQVSRPIYRSAMGRWKRFERHLGPLLEALGND